MMWRIEQLYVHEMSHMVPFSDQTPIVALQRCERRVSGALKPDCSFLGLPLGEAVHVGTAFLTYHNGKYAS